VELLPVHQAFLVKSLIDGSKRGVVEVLTKAINSECRISINSPICRVVGKRPDRERYARIRHPDTDTQCDFGDKQAMATTRHVLHQGPSRARGIARMSSLLIPYYRLSVMLPKVCDRCGSRIWNVQVKVVETRALPLWMDVKF